MGDITVLEDHSNRHPGRVIAARGGERFVLHDFLGASASAGTFYDGEWRHYEESEILECFVTGGRVPLDTSNALDQALRASRR